MVAYLWGQKVFRGFRIYGSKGFHIFGVLIQKVFVSFRSERFSYLSDPEGFRIFLPAKSEFRVLAGNRLTHIFGDKNKY